MTDEPASSAELEARLKELESLGLKVDPKIARSMDDDAVPLQERVSRVVTIYRQLIETSLTLLEGERRKMQQVRSRLPPDAPQFSTVEGMLKAFEKQVEGLQLLLDFFDTGDRAHLDQAKDLISVGAEEAQDLAARAQSGG